MMLPRRLRVFGAAAVALLIMCGLIFVMYPTVIRDIGYMARPLWDSPSKEWTVINRYGSSCDMYGWSDRGKGRERKVYDAIIFSIELDILELRLTELWDVVDVFVIVESNTTFAGHGKRLFLKENMARFGWAKEKLRYHQVTHERRPGESMWASERRMRERMQDALAQEGVGSEDLVINSDADEIPHHAVVDLLRRCDGAPPALHLSLKGYLYSFEFPEYPDVPENSWRATIKLYGRDRTYTHSRRSDYLFANAGWHCSYCFPNLGDHRFKMSSYSHSDRLTSPKMLDEKRLMERICNGKEIFDLPPERFNYRDLIYAYGRPKRNYDYSNMPKGLVENRKYAFLLPGGRNCTGYVTG
ncbi:hypothetical protein LPJ61_005659 [Coemansia biformis]|uniref:Glycosyltransferase family 17 protein n=1 Tax=Coemansia biformis TaxID=1286918 RepID=A0A9W7Y1R1_9FUNG|nr:hypothetical protein LPJ61_005659 [Coemansia biformis]